MSSEYRRSFLKVAAFFGGAAILNACAPNVTTRPTETPTNTEIIPTFTPPRPEATPSPTVVVPPPTATLSPNEFLPLTPGIENISGWDITISYNALLLTTTAYGVPPQVFNYQTNIYFLKDKYIEDPKNDILVFVDDNGIGNCRIAAGLYENEFRKKTVEIPAGWQEDDWVSVRASEAVLFCFADIATKRGFTQEDSPRKIAQDYLDLFIQGTYPLLITNFQRPGGGNPPNPPPQIPGQIT